MQGANVLLPHDAAGAHHQPPDQGHGGRGQEPGGLCGVLPALAAAAVSTIVLIGVVVPFALPALLPILLLFYFLYQYFQARDLPSPWLTLTGS